MRKLTCNLYAGNPHERSGPGGKLRLHLGEAKPPGTAAAEAAAEAAEAGPLPICYQSGHAHSNGESGRAAWPERRQESRSVDCHTTARRGHRPHRQSTVVFWWMAVSHTRCCRLMSLGTLCPCGITT